MEHVTWNNTNNNTQLGCGSRHTKQKSIQIGLIVVLCVEIIFGWIIQLKLGRSKEDLNKDVVPCFIFNCFITSNFTFSVAVAVNAINGVSGNRNFNIPNFLYDGRKS